MKPRVKRAPNAPCGVYRAIVVDEGMSGGPDPIRLGDFVTIDADLQPRHGDLVVAAHGARPQFAKSVLRRFVRSDGVAILEASAPGVRPKPLGRGRVYGVVVRHSRVLPAAGRTVDRTKYAAF